MRKYSNIDRIMELDFPDAVNFIVLAKSKELEERLFIQWVVQLPWMSTEDDTYISFDDYKNKVTGADVCTKSRAEIMAECFDIERKWKEANYNST